TDWWRRAVIGGNVHNGSLVAIVHRGGDRTEGPCRDLDGTTVTRLAAGCGVEHRTIEHDAAPIVDCNHTPRAVARPGIAPIEEFGHDGFPSLTPPKAAQGTDRLRGFRSPRSPGQHNSRRGASTTAAGRRRPNVAQLPPVMPSALGLVNEHRRQRGRCR